MKPTTPAELIRLIDEVASRVPGGALAFDGDGTLWSGDIGDDFFAAIVEAGIDGLVHDALVREASEAELHTGGTTGDLARRIHAAYLAGRFPEERVCEVITWMSAGRSRTDLERFCAGVVVETGVRERLHPEVVEIVAHARSQGWEAFIVSASPRSIVVEAAKLVGIGADHVVAVVESYDADGRGICGVERPIPYGPGKVRRLRERLGARTLYAAFGDNAFDVALLNEAEVPVAVRPKPRLLERAAEVPGIRVLDGRAHTH